MSRTATPPATGKNIVIRRDVKPPVLHVALKRPLGAPPNIVRQPFAHTYVIWAFGVVMLFCACVADFTEEAWPLAVVIVLPIAALLYDTWCRRQLVAMPPVPQREARIVADKRPILLRPVLLLPPGRPARLVAKLPRLLVQIPAGSSRRIAKRKPRLLARNRPSSGA